LEGVRPTRTADDLIGRKVQVSEYHLLPRAKHHNRCLVHKTCKITRAKQNKQGEITHIYVVRAKEMRFDRRTGRVKPKGWLKTEKRIAADWCARPIRRIRRRGNSSFRWKFVNGYSITTTGGVQWEGGQATLAWWLNNPALISFQIEKRIDENKSDLRIKKKVQ
jgi:hypothetical protein